jgi:DNA-binding MarR family transcriptional regulator
MPVTLALLKRAYLATKKRMDEELAQFGLTSAQMDILMTLSHAGGSLEQRELQGQLCVTAPTITGVVDNLVARELVTRRLDVADARVKHLELTAAGRAKVEILLEAEQAFAANFYRNLSESDIKCLNNSLLQISNNMDKAT